MNFEDDLRHRLHRSADDLQLTGEGVDTVVGRARRRQRHRRAAVGTVGGVALIAGAVGFIGLLDQGDPGVAIGTAPGLPSLGPLELQWTSTEGGVFTDRASTVAPDGTIYALSTAPGARFDPNDQRWDTLYRLGDDGTWVPRSPENGSGPVDVAAGSSLLYGVSTAPGAGAVGYLPRLSTSSDGGQTWDDEDLPPVGFPSDAVPWHAGSTVQVEATGTAAVAVISTSFSINPADLPGIAALPVDELAYRSTAEGLEVVRYERDTSPEAATKTTAPGAYDPKPVLTVSWADLGVEGPQDLFRTDVYVDDGSGWRQVPANLSVIYPRLTVAAGDFVLSGSSPWQVRDGETSQLRTYASSDGSTWNEVNVPSNNGYGVVGLGDAWVVRGADDRSLSVSTDRGQTWQRVSLPDLGSGPVRSVLTITSGPLGLGVFVGADGEGGMVQGLLFTRDLQDWSTFLPDLSGGYDQMPSVVVGTDRIVVTVTSYPKSPGDPGESRTYIGTPVRAGSNTDPTAPATTAPVTSDVPLSTTTSSTVIATSSTTTTEPVPASTTTTTAG